MKRRFTRTQKTIFAAVIILTFIALLFFYISMIYRVFAKEYFVKQAIQISEANQDPVFKIDKVMIFSSANAVDNTEEKSLKDLDISQFTDIAISIDNTSYIPDLGDKNTVKALRVDNIEITSDQPTGFKSVTYKNPMEFGTFTMSEASNSYTSKDNVIKCAPIDYEVTYKNPETPDYSKPVFYTDCSNPIALSYLNKNVVSHYSMPDNSNVEFDGSLLKMAKVDLVALTTTVSFNIIITNNLDETFTYNVRLNLKPDEESGITTNGYAFQGRESSEGNAYNFFKDI